MTRRWEYSVAKIAPDTRVSEINRLGDAGWELCGITGDGTAWFKRDIVAKELTEQGDRLAAEREGRSISRETTSPARPAA